MAGLLDFLNDPEQQQILGIASGLLSAGGPSPYPRSIGQGFGEGLLTGSKLAAQTRQGQLMGLQGEQLKTSLEAQKRTQAAIDAFAQQLPPEQRGIFLADPASYIKNATEKKTVSPGQTIVQGNTPIFTAQPNLHFQDVGGSVLGLDPQTGQPRGGIIPKTIAPSVHFGDLGGQLGVFGVGPQGVTNLGGVSKTATPGELLTNRLGWANFGLNQQRTNFETQVGPNGLTPSASQQLRIAAPLAGAKVTGEAQAHAALDLPQAEINAGNLDSTIEQMIGTKGRALKKGEKEVAPHPGFENVVGMAAIPGKRFIPGTDAANFDALLEQARGGAFMQAYQTLKGGGQITEIEGTKATNAITRMNRAQSEEEFVKAAREFQDAYHAGVSKLKKQAGASAGWSIRPLVGG